MSTGHKGVATDKHAQATINVGDLKGPCAHIYGHSLCRGWGGICFQQRFISFRHLLQTSCHYSYITHSTLAAQNIVRHNHCVSLEHQGLDTNQRTKPKHTSHKPNPYENHTPTPKNKKMPRNTRPQSPQNKISLGKQGHKSQKNKA